MLCSATDITLKPDWTTIVQLFIFLFAAASLSIFVIRPIMRIIEKRKAFTEDAAEEAAKLMNESEQLEIGRREVITMALKEAYEEFEKRSAEHRRKADSVIADARARTTEALGSSALSIESVEELNEKEAELRARDLSDAIVSRVIGGR